MKLVVALCLAAPAAGFGFGKKGAKAAPKKQRSSSGAQYPSVALPWTTTPLDGSLVGDVGFDPLGFSKYAPGAWWVGDEGDGSLKIFREAELMHGRIAQLACLGWVFPELAHFPGKDGAFGKMNPFEAVAALADVAVALAPARAAVGGARRRRRLGGLGGAAAAPTIRLASAS